jgi:hypothetical protein
MNRALLPGGLRPTDQASLRDRPDQDFYGRWHPVIEADRVFRGTTAGAVVGVTAVAAVASYEHACALVRAHGGRDGRPGWCHSRWMG